MAGEFVWEVVKGVGSLAGLLSTGYLLYDRIWKHIPSFVIVSRPLMAGAAVDAAFLAIKNNATRPILVSWENGLQDQLLVAKSQELRAIVTTLFEGRTTVPVDVNEVRELPLLMPNNFSEMEPGATVQMTLQWKFAQPYLWQPERKIRVWIRKRDLDALVENRVEV